MCQMRENPALQHVPMAVGGEGMLVIIHYYFIYVLRIIEFYFSQHQTI